MSSHTTVIIDQDTSSVATQQPGASVNVDQNRVPAKPLYVALIGLLVIGILVWPSLFCLIPALVFGAFALHADKKGNEEQSKTLGNISLGCSISGMIFGCVMFVMAVIVIVVKSAQNAQNSYYLY